MASIPFYEVRGMNVYELEMNLAEKHPNWKRINDDPHIRVYANLHEYPKQYKAIVACDGKGLVRSCEVKVRGKDGTWENYYLYDGVYQSLRTYSDVKLAHLVEDDFDRRIKQNRPEWMKFDLKRAEREVYRKYHKKFSHDPYYVPLLNNSKEWRTVSDDGGESCTDFIIIPNTWDDELWETEEGYEQINEDIEDFVFSTVGYRTSYDFSTGLVVTMSWSFKRLSCGVAIVHNRGIDW